MGGFMSAFLVAVPSPATVAGNLIPKWLFAVSRAYESIAVVPFVVVRKLDMPRTRLFRNYIRHVALVLVVSKKKSLSESLQFLTLHFPGGFNLFFPQSIGPRTNVGSSSLLFPSLQYMDLPLICCTVSLKHLRCSVGLKE